MDFQSPLRRRLTAGLTLGLVSPALRAQAGGERYPAKPIRMIVPAAAGGPSDLVARMVAQKLGEALGGPVVVENMAGAGMMLGTSAVAKAAGDGHTLLFTTSNPIVMSPFTMKKLPYDVRKDFVTVAHIGTTSLAMYVNTATPIRSVREFGEAARSAAGALSYGSYGVGSSAHVLMEYLARQLGVKVVHVPYKGVAPMIQDLVGGQLSTAIADLGVPAPFVKSGRLRSIAVTGNRRVPALPEVPTFGEQGIAGMEPFSPWWGVFAPAATAPGIVARLGNEVARIARTPEFVNRLGELGGQVTGEGPERASAIVRSEWDQWARIIGELKDISFE